MRLTQVVRRQHIGYWFKTKWRHQGKRVPVETGVEADLRERGIEVFDPEDVLTEKREFQKIEVLSLEPRFPPKDESHPLWHDRVCHMYRNYNVLLEGIDQARLLTKTVEINKGLPERLEKLVGAEQLPDQDKLVQRSIMMAQVFDPTQEKLPHLHDPARPAWIFPRVMGIPDYKRNKIITHRLMDLCQVLCGKHSEARNRVLVDDSFISVPIEKDGDLIQFAFQADLLLSASKPLQSPANSSDVENTCSFPLPDLYPIKHTVTLEQENLYEIRNAYPIPKDSKCPHAHTAIFHYNETEVKNEYETPVTEQQFLGRTLLHTFGVAVAQARQRFGENVKDLPEPITLQSIQTDGKYFHFGVLQLNTVNISGSEGIKNIFWMTQKIPLFDSCVYNKGRPELTSYNPEVFSNILAFYCNGLEL